MPCLHFLQELLPLGARHGLGSNGEGAADGPRVLLLILPAIGIRGSFWLCFAIGAAVFAATLALGGEESTAPAEQEARHVEERAAAGRDAWVLLAAAFAYQRMRPRAREDLREVPAAFR